MMASKSRRRRCKLAGPEALAQRRDSGTVSPSLFTCRKQLARRRKLTGNSAQIWRRRGRPVGRLHTGVAVSKFPASLMMLYRRSSTTLLRVPETLQTIGDTSPAQIGRRRLLVGFAASRSRSTCISPSTSKTSHLDSSVSLYTCRCVS